MTWQGPCCTPPVMPQATPRWPTTREDGPGNVPATRVRLYGDKRGESVCPSRRSGHGRCALLSAALLFAVLGQVAPARAQAIPEPVTLPQQLALDEALKILRSRGLDLLIAEAQVHSAEGDVGIAGAVPNPSVSVGYGRLFTYDPTPGCDKATCDVNQYSAGVSDQAAIEDSLSGKRSLRLKVANAALAAAKLSRRDALRTLEFQVKSAYLQVARAQRSLEFANQAQTTNRRTFALFQTRLRARALNEGDLARGETQKLENDHGLDRAPGPSEQARDPL